jgi:hypothetical protein
MTRLPVEGHALRPRNIIDLRPLALSTWENEGGAVPEIVPPARQVILPPHAIYERAHR